jgi:hypothetical protein
MLGYRDFDGVHELIREIDNLHHKEMMTEPWEPETVYVEVPVYMDKEKSEKASESHHTDE